MNEITRIHLARTSYEIDVAAKKDLEKYLVAIKKSLGSEDDAMEDIEIRMTEILASRGVKKDDVITESDVKAIKEQLGEPTVFSAEDGEKAKTKSSETIAEKVNRTFSEKKYFRDPENGVLGGVLAGLSAYTGWDVTLLRVLFVVLAFFSVGFFIVLYLVAWICAPEAKTTSEKLEMRGEPVNIDSIKESAKESAKDLGKKAEKVGKTAAEKASKIAAEIEGKTLSVSNALGRVFMMCFGIIGLLIVFGLTIGLVVSGNHIITSIATMDIVAKPVLIVAASLTVAACALLIVLFSIIAVGLVSGTFKKGARAGLVTTLIISLLLLVGAVGTTSSWISVSTPEDRGAVIEKVLEDARYDYKTSDGSSFCIGICH